MSVVVGVDGVRPRLPVRAVAGGAPYDLPEDPMTPVLRSFTEGRWHEGAGELRPLLDAATGETVAALPAKSPDPVTVLARGAIVHRADTPAFHRDPDTAHRLLGVT